MRKTRLSLVAKPLAVVTMLGGGFLAGSQAWANTAADTTIRNVVTVNYADANNNAQTAISAQVDVYVNLVKAAPTLTLTSASTVTIDQSQTAAYTYLLTNNGNGIQSFDVTNALTPSAGVASASASYAPAGSIKLGASTIATGVTIAAAGTTTITVPADNTSDASINGITAGSTVVISGQVYTVSSIGADTASPGTTTITVNGNGTASAALAAGTLISGRTTVTVTINPGADSNAAIDQTIADVTAANDHTTTALVSGNTSTTTTVAGVGLSVIKYVRNITHPIVGGGAVTWPAAGGNTYYASGVNGNPGDTLEYMIVVSKSASASSAKNVIVTDNIPQFTSYVTGTMKIDNGAGFSAALTETADADAATYVGGATPQVTFYAGAGGTGSPAKGGTIASSGAAHVIFQVTIN